MFDGLWQDFRFGFRTLRKNGGFTAIAVLTLALGIGGNATIFSLVHGVLLRQPPYPHPEKVVMVWEKRVRENMATNVVSPADYLDWKNQNTVFESMAALQYAPVDLLGGTEPQRVPAGVVGAEFFNVLGIQPQLGRFFNEHDEVVGQHRVLVLTHGLWQRSFGGDPKIVGQAININGVAWMVVGVLPKNFEFPYAKVEMWVPMPITEDFHHIRGAHFLTVFARLKPNVSMQTAQVEMDGIALRLEAQNPGINRGHSANVLPLREELVKEIRPALKVLSYAIGFVLLIACANVSNLLLASAVRRQREIAVRQAVGASRWRLVRQLLVESLLLAALAGGVSCIVAVWGISALGPLLEQSGWQVPLPPFHMDITVVLFLAAISALSCLLFGLVPALSSSRTNVVGALKGEGTLTRLLGGNQRVRAGLLVGEVALSTVLLVGASLMVRTFVQLRAVQPGFESSKVMALPIALNGKRYGDDQKKLAFFEEMMRRTAAMPGIESAGSADILPLSGQDSRTGINIENREPNPNENTRAHHRVVTPGFLETMRIPLLEGRTIRETDTSAGQKVAVINLTAARRYWPGQSAIGKRFMVGRETVWTEIVGVVGDVRDFGLDLDSNPVMYLPLAQSPGNWMNIVVRSNRSPGDIAAALKTEVQSIDKDQPVGTLVTMEELVSNSIAPRAMNLLLLGLFAAVALVMAAAGIYGVISNVVTQRTREIGIRIALGAQRGDVLRMVLGQGIRLVLVGLVVGLAGSFELAQVMKKMLYHTSAADPMTLAVVPVLLGAVAFVACFVPAQRATGVDPLVALRHE